MKSKRILPRPSATGEVIVGPGYVFRREDEQIHGHEPPLPEVELTPVGPVVNVRDLTTAEPTDQQEAVARFLEHFRAVWAGVDDAARSRLREQLVGEMARP
ncbi:MAG: hypothetical protein U0804_01940 [Gemmataceae bacterium]